jgi:hypothetical protein
MNPPRPYVKFLCHVIRGARMTKYSPKAQEKISKVMDEYKDGKLTIGNSDQKVTSRKQAVAIGISEARKEGDKVPREPKHS